MKFLRKICKKLSGKIRSAINLVFSGNPFDDYTLSCRQQMEAIGFYTIQNSYRTTVDDHCHAKQQTSTKEEEEEGTTGHEANIRQIYCYNSADLRVLEGFLNRMRRMYPKFLFADLHVGDAILLNWIRRSETCEYLSFLKADGFDVVFICLGILRNVPNYYDEAYDDGRCYPTTTLLVYYKAYKTFFHFNTTIAGARRKQAVKIAAKCKDYFAAEYFIDLPCHCEHRCGGDDGAADRLLNADIVNLLEIMTKLIFLYVAKDGYLKHPINLINLNDSDQNAMRSFIMDQYITEMKRNETAYVRD